MKRISSKQNGFFKRFIINVPFVLIVALAAACFFFGATLIFYCFVTAAAFKSAMISLVLLGAGFILTGAGLGLIKAFKLYHDFYDVQMGWQYPDRKPKEDVTVVDGKKPFKAYLTPSNFALAFLLVGAIFTIISAALGCISRDKWVQAIGPYREAHGYFAEVQSRNVTLSIENSAEHVSTLTRIDIDLITKQAVIVFTDDEEQLGHLTLKAYVSYEDQLRFSCDSQPITYFSISESPAPSSEKSALDKLIFFADDILKSVPSEKQIVIYLPSFLKNSVTVNGEYILAQ